VTVKRFVFQINAVLFNFLVIKKSWKKCITISIKKRAAQLFEIVPM